MNINVAFFIRHFTERGTENSIFNYAFYNEKILKNKSIVITYNKNIREENKKFDNSSREVFENIFKIIDINYIEELKEIFKKEKITHAYIQSHGFYLDYYQLMNREIWGKCQTTYHYVFGPMARQGSDIRCVIGKDLNKRFFKKIPVLPYIVNRHIFQGNLRKELNIKKNNLVIGRHGGFKTFDIKFVKEAIKEILEIRKDIIFLFLNTEKFIENERVIYLPKTTSVELKSKFIDTCDAMLHARIDGETFGLAVAEFSAANKPIITYAYSKDSEHLRILNKKAITYKNKKSLINIIFKLNKNQIINKDWNCYKIYEPNHVIKIFDELCLKKKSKKFNILEFIYDLPWELIIFIKYNIYKILKNIFKVFPFKFKTRLKNFF